MAYLRGFLAVLVAVTMSGCTSTGTEGGGLGGPSLQYHEDGRTVIAEDQYMVVSFEATRAFRLEVDVNVASGPSVDVLVLDELNFGQYRDGNAFVHYGSCGGVAAQAFSRTCTLGPDTYYVVFDNSDLGNVSPPWNMLDDGADTAWDVRVYA